MKKVIVVDDYPEIHAEWRRVLRIRWPKESDCPAVVDLNKPEDVAAALVEHPDAGLVVVDLDFGRASRHTGLQALVQVEEHQRRHINHDLSTVIMTADEQDSRLLLLLSAFQLFDPMPIDLIRKSDKRERVIVEIVQTLKNNQRPRNDRFRDFLHSRINRPVMYRLVCESYGKDRRALDLWRALLEANSTSDLKAALGLKNQIYEYMKRAAEAAAEVAKQMHRPPEALLNVHAMLGEEGKRRDAGDVFGPLSSFAQRNVLFFEAPELDVIAAKFDAGG